MRADSTYEALRHAILGGRFAPNARLLEQGLATWLKVSRTPVREALQRLAAEGLVATAPRRGFVVTALQPDVILDTYVVREVLEGLAARLAAQHADDFMLIQLNDEYDGMVRAAAKGPVADLVQRTASFEWLIVKASRSALLEDILGGLRDRLRLLRDPNFRVPGRKEAALEELRALLDAIERREPDAAEECARLHVRNARQVRLRMLTQTDHR